MKHTKVCPRCNLEKDYNEFYPDKYQSDRLRSQCKSCCSKVRKERYVKEYFGIDEKTYNDYYKRKLIEQDGRCAQCGMHCSDKRLVLDHNHNKRGIEALRGLLCDNCNTGFGKLGDTSDSLYQAYEYLTRYNS